MRVHLRLLMRGVRSRVRKCVCRTNVSKTSAPLRNVCLCVCGVSGIVESAPEALY